MMLLLMLLNKHFKIQAFFGHFDLNYITLVVNNATIVLVFSFISFFVTGLAIAISSGLAKVALLIE